MEPITILIYVSIVCIIILTGFLSVLMFNLIKVLVRINHVLNYIEKIQSYIEYLESWPINLIKNIFGK